MKTFVRLMSLFLLAAQTTGCGYLFAGYLVYRGSELNKRSGQAQVVDAATNAAIDAESDAATSTQERTETPIPRNIAEAVDQFELFKECTGLKDNDIAFIPEGSDVSSFCFALDSVSFLQGIDGELISTNID